MSRFAKTVAVFEKRGRLVFRLVIIFTSLLAIPLGSSYAQNQEDQLVQAKDKLLQSVEGLMEVDGILCRKYDDDELVEEIKENVRNNLRDPESTRFRNLNMIRREGIAYACGELNAKNAYGGYTGFKMFLASCSSVFYSEEEASGRVVIAHYCVP